MCSRYYVRVGSTKGRSVVVEWLSPAGERRADGNLLRMRSFILHPVDHSVTRLFSWRKTICHHTASCCA